MVRRGGLVVVGRAQGAHPIPPVEGSFFTPLVQQTLLRTFQGDVSVGHKGRGVVVLVDSVSIEKISTEFPSGIRCPHLLIKSAFKEEHILEGSL